MLLLFFAVLLYKLIAHTYGYSYTNKTYEQPTTYRPWANHALHTERFLHDQPIARGICLPRRPFRKDSLIRYLDLDHQGHIGRFGIQRLYHRSDYQADGFFLHNSGQQPEDRNLYGCFWNNNPCRPRFFGYSRYHCGDGLPPVVRLVESVQQVPMPTCWTGYGNGIRGKRSSTAIPSSRRNSLPV